MPFQLKVETIEYILLIKRAHVTTRHLITKYNILVSICILVITLITGGYRLVSGGNILKSFNH